MADRGEANKPNRAADTTVTNHSHVLVCSQNKATTPIIIGRHARLPRFIWHQPPQYQYYVLLLLVGSSAYLVWLIILLMITMADPPRLSPSTISRRSQRRISHDHQYNQPYQILGVTVVIVIVKKRKGRAGFTVEACARPTAAERR